MKKIILIMLCTFPLFTFAQSEKKNFFEGGLLLGLNPSQVDGDALYGFHKLGLNAGAYGAFPLYQHALYFNFELLYSEKGSKSAYAEINGDPNQSYTLQLRYADIPMYLQYRDKDGKTRWGLGLSYGRLFSANETIDFLADPDVLNEYKKRDVCWLADFQFFATKHIGFNIRYSYSLLYIRNFVGWQYNGTFSLNPPYGTNQYNNFLTTRIVYTF